MEGVRQVCRYSVGSIEGKLRTMTLNCSARAILLYIGSSIAYNIDTEQISQFLDGWNCDFVMAKAYSSVYDGLSLFPLKNFERVVFQSNQGVSPNVIVLQAPSVDIRNSRRILENHNSRDKRLHYLSKYQLRSYFLTMQEIAKQGSRNMVDIACQALTNNSNLQKVVIMEVTPVYNGLQFLHDLANQELHTYNYDKRVVIGTHDFRDDRAKMFLTRDAPQFDGWHFRGGSGRSSYTNSVMRILQEHVVTP